jgi:hypothetical protein
MKSKQERHSWRTAPRASLNLSLGYGTNQINAPERMAVDSQGKHYSAPNACCWLPKHTTMRQIVIIAARVLSVNVGSPKQVQVTGGTVLTSCVAVPYIYFGGIGPMFAALARAKPRQLVMPGATTNLGHTWYVSTVFLVALGFYMWPHYIGASFTAKSGDVLRRNAVIMPFYSITMPLMFFVGLAATLVLPVSPMATFRC